MCYDRVLRWISFDGRNDDVSAARERAEPERNGVPGLSAHDDRVTHGALLEAFEVVGQMPEKAVILPDDPVLPKGCDEADLIHGNSISAPRVGGVKNESVTATACDRNEIHNLVPGLKRKGFFRELVIEAESDTRPLDWSMSEEPIVPTVTSTVPSTEGIEGSSGNKHHCFIIVRYRSRLQRFLNRIERDTRCNFVGTCGQFRNDIAERDFRRERYVRYANRKARYERA